MASIIEKQTWLVDTVQRHGRITLPELSSIWEDNVTLNPDGQALAERTFHRHREDIERIFGISIKCDKRDMNRYYIDGDESDSKGKEVRSWLLSTIAVDNMLNQSRDLRDRIQFEEIPSGRQFLSVLISCIRDNLKVRMTYRSFSMDEPQSIVFEPYFVKVRDQRWYVIGPSDKHPGDPHTYALDRVVSIVPTAETFIYPDDFNPDEYFLYSFGIFHSKVHPMVIKVRADATQSKYLDSLPLHRSQEKTEEGDGYSIYRYFMSPDYDLIQEIASKGAGFEVLEPVEFRKTVADFIRKSAEQYKKKK